MGSIDEGIFILGTSRSGTTLLRRILDAHPDICCPPETHIPRACARFLAADPSASNIPGSVVDALWFSGLDEQAVLDRVRELAFGLFREIRARSGKRVWADKASLAVFHLDQFERLFADRCRFLCMFRHPLDAIASMHDYFSNALKFYVAEIHEYIRRFQQPLIALAHAWVDANERLLRFIETHNERCVSMRYEDLIARPDDELARVLGAWHCQTDVPALLERALGSAGTVGFGDWKTYQKRTLDASSIGKWKSTLPEASIAELSAIVSPTMAKLGYEPIAIPNVLTGEAAKRLYQAGLLLTHSKSGP